MVLIKQNYVDYIILFLRYVFQHKRLEFVLRFIKSQNN